MEACPGSSAGPGRPARVPDEETELEGSESNQEKWEGWAFQAEEGTCDELKSLMCRMLPLWRQNQVPGA